MASPDTSRLSTERITVTTNRKLLQQLQKEKTDESIRANNNSRLYAVPSKQMSERDSLDDTKYRYVSTNANEFNEDQARALEAERWQRIDSTLYKLPKSNEFRLDSSNADSVFENSRGNQQINPYSAKMSTYDSLYSVDRENGRYQADKGAKKATVDFAQVKQLNRSEEDNETRQLADEAAYQRRLKRRISRHTAQAEQYQIPKLALSDSEDDKKIGDALDIALHDSGNIVANYQLGWESVEEEESEPNDAVMQQHGVYQQNNQQHSEMDNQIYDSLDDKTDQINHQPYTVAVSVEKSRQPRPSYQQQQPFQQQQQNVQQQQFQQQLQLQQQQSQLINSYGGQHIAASNGQNFVPAGNWAIPMDSQQNGTQLQSATIPYPLMQGSYGNLVAQPLLVPNFAYANVNPPAALTPIQYMQPVLAQGQLNPYQQVIQPNAYQQPSQQLTYQQQPLQVPFNQQQQQYQQPQQDHYQQQAQSLYQKPTQALQMLYQPEVKQISQPLASPPAKTKQNAPIPSVPTARQTEESSLWAQNQVDYVTENKTLLRKPPIAKSYSKNHALRKVGGNKKLLQQQEQMSPHNLFPERNDPTNPGRVGWKTRDNEVSTAPPVTEGSYSESQPSEQAELLWQQRVQSLGQRNKNKGHKGSSSVPGGGGKNSSPSKYANDIKSVDRSNQQAVPPPRQLQPLRAMAEPIKIEAVLDPNKIPADGSLPLRRTVITEDGQKVNIDINLKMLTPRSILGSLGQRPALRASDDYNDNKLANSYQPMQRVAYQANSKENFHNRLEAYNRHQYDDEDEVVPYGKGNSTQQYENVSPKSSHYKVLPSIGPNHEFEELQEQNGDKVSSNDQGYMREYQKQKNNSEASYKKYTINDYRRMKQDVSTKLGGLGPSLDDDTVKEKRDKLNRQKNYAKKVNEKNMQDLNERPLPVRSADKDESRNKRRAALDYAKNVPKPKANAPKSSRAVEKQALGSGTLQGDSQWLSSADTGGGAYGDHLDTFSSRNQPKSEMFTAFNVPVADNKAAKPAAPKTDVRNLDLEHEMQELQRLQERHERERQEVAQLLQNMNSVLAQ